jgi:hypothetical protein
MAWHSIPFWDLTDGKYFPWWRWLANLPDQASDMLCGDHGIHSFWAKRDGHHRCFVVVQADGTALSLEISKEQTNITELDLHESPLHHDLHATTKPEERWTVADIRRAHSPYN